MNSDATFLAMSAPGQGPGAVYVFKRTGSSWNQQGEALVPTNHTGTPFFGTSLRFNQDATLLLITGFADNSFTGAAWVFQREGSVWSLLNDIIIPEDSIGATSFGNQCRISLDGTKIAIAGYKDDTDNGAVWYYS